MKVEEAIEECQNRSKWKELVSAYPAGKEAIILEYIRKTCRLGSFTQFDLCDQTGVLLGLFSMPTYAYATEHFVHKKTYYVIVLRTEADRRISVFPQLNHDNRIYDELKQRVKRYVTTGEVSSQSTLQPQGKLTPPLTQTKSIMKKK